MCFGKEICSNGKIVEVLRNKKFMESGLLDGGGGAGLYYYLGIMRFGF